MLYVFKTFDISIISYNYKPLNPLNIQAMCDFWCNWNNLTIPSEFKNKLNTNQTKRNIGWVWLGPCGSGKTHIASIWTRKWAEWAELDYGTSVWYVNTAFIHNWDTWLSYLDTWISQKRGKAKNGDYDSWIWFDVCERLVPSQQLDLIQRLREKSADKVGVLWTTSSVFSWIPELLSGCYVWSWYNYLMLPEVQEEWFQKFGKHTKLWDYNSLNYLIPDIKIKQNGTLKSVPHLCKIAWKAIIEKDFPTWVECGNQTELFRIPWNDMLDTIKSIIDENGYPITHSYQEKLRHWWSEGVKLAPLFPRIDSYWHQWNVWGLEGICIFHLNKPNLKKEIATPELNNHYDLVDPRLWLNDLWDREMPKMGNLIIWGPPGGGKTSFVESWIHKWFGNPPDKRWVYYRNSSMEKWNKLFKNELEPFLSSDPFKWGPCPTPGINWRWVVLDEVDQMGLDAQEFLRSQIVHVQNEKIPVFFLLIANERSKLNWALSSKFQIIHWMTPEPNWVKNIFQPAEPCYKRNKELVKSMYHWWLGYQTDLKEEIGVSTRWWEEESGDLRRYKLRCHLGMINEYRVKNVYWLSRGDLLHEFWKEWCSSSTKEEISNNFVLNKIPLWFPAEQKDVYLQYLKGNQNITDIKKYPLPNYAQEVYDALMIRSFHKKILPPNISWIYPMGVCGLKWLNQIWLSFIKIYQKWDIQLNVIDIYDTQHDANWVREVLKTKTRLVSGGDKKGHCWILLNAHLLEEDAQVSLRRLIDDTRNKIVWWFGVCHILNWMEPLRSRAEPLLITPTKEYQWNSQVGLRWIMSNE